jgi:phosphate transport system permease protein
VTLLDDLRTERPPGAESVPRRRQFDQDLAREIGASAIAAAALVWVPFALAGLNAPFGALVCWYLAFVTLYAVVVRQRHGGVEAKDRLATVVIWSGLVVAILPLILLIYFVVVRGGHAVLTKFPHFLTHDMRSFGSTDPVSRAGMKAAMVGSVEQVLLAAVISVPIGVLAATYINELGGRLAAIVRTIADAMTGLPTIIAGLFIYSAWVRPRGVQGRTGLAAGLALAVVMLPTIVRTAEEVLRIVSNDLREAALALGAPEWRVVLRVVLPTARTGLVTAAILGVARVIGETAPVLLTTASAVRTNYNLFSRAQDDLPLRIWQFASSSSPTNVQAAWGGALLLMLIILTLFTLARILGSGTASRSRLTGLRRRAS